MRAQPGSLRSLSARPRGGVRAAAFPLATAGTERWEPGALLLVVLLLVSFGLVELYSASTFMAQTEGRPAHFYALRQAIGVLPGVALCALLARIDYRRLQVAAWPLLAIVLVMLVLVVMPGTESIAPRVNGARRWLRLGITIQPSELAKLALIIWTAALAVKKQDRMHSLRRGLAPFLVVWLAVLVPVVGVGVVSTGAAVGAGVVLVPVGPPPWSWAPKPSVASSTGTIAAPASCSVTVRVPSF